MNNHSTLIFGATGATGKYILQEAIKQGDKVTVFVRDAAKLDASLRSRITVIQGDLTDKLAVSKVVRDTKPTGIIVASTPPRKAPIQNLNAIAVPVIVETLAQQQWLPQTNIIYLGGIFTLPKDEAPTFFGQVIKYILSSLIGLQAQIADNDKVADYLYSSSHKDLRYTFVRMRLPEEGSSRGKLVVSDATASTIAFCDMAEFLVGVSHELGSAIGKAVVVAYQK
ncbi:hypothetical protein BDR26DRAFT_921472 [Obelidium mucronatum]|nr:hypothetical protein BDR26DRAFT_921472 [Obelidium mucronatum]